MPTPMIRLRRSQADDLAAILPIGSAHLARVARAIEESKPTISPKKLRTIIAAETGDQVAETISRVLIGLARAMRRAFPTLSALLDSLTEVLTAEWEQSQLESWRDCRPQIERLLSTKSVVLTAKAADLAIDYDKFCVDARILTDIRPVFDAPRDEIIGSAIIQILKIEFISPDSEEGNVTIALDLEDIEQLRQACETATKKARITRAMIEDRLRLEAIMPGEGLE